MFGMDFKNPLHLDVVDRYMRLMGDKTIPDWSRVWNHFIPHESQVSIYHNQGVAQEMLVKEVIPQKNIIIK